RGFLSSISGVVLQLQQCVLSWGFYNPLHAKGPAVAYGLGFKNKVFTQFVQFGFCKSAANRNFSVVSRSLAQHKNGRNHTKERIREFAATQIVNHNAATGSVDKFLHQRAQLAVLEM